MITVFRDPEIALGIECRVARIVQLPGFCSAATECEEEGAIRGEDLYVVPRGVGHVQIAVGIGGEALARTYGYVVSHPFKNASSEDTLSLTSWMGKIQILPGAQAAAVENTIRETMAPSDTTNLPLPMDEGCSTSGASGYFNWVPQPVSNLFSRVTDCGCLDASKQYFYNNQDWLLVTASVIGIATVVNCFSARKIQNDYVRNIVSFAAGVGVTWAVYNYGLGTALNINTVSDIGFRMMSYQGVLSVAAPLTSRLVAVGATAIKMASKPLAYTPNAPHVPSHYAMIKK